METIGPKDKATLKYLSNVIDNNTGEISKPFTIKDKKYQIVRCATPEKNVVLGVYCFDDFNEDGSNVIHDVDYFDKTVATPMKESLAAPMGSNIQPLPPKKTESLNLGEYKHFIVNKESGEFRKFKTSEELAKDVMNETETYMNIKEFKKYFDEKVFGNKRKMTKKELEESIFRRKIIKVKDIKNGL